MNVLFFCHHDFTSNSLGHIAGFAAGLKKRGHACAVAIPGDDRSSAQTLGPTPPFQPLLFSDTWEHAGTLFPDRRDADVLHAWTPREHVRRAVLRCRQEMPAAKLVVHLEDSEEHLLTAFTGESIGQLRAKGDAELAALLPPQLAHPREYRRFLQTADGVTGIVESLREFAPGGMPYLELKPGVDFSVYHPGTAPTGLREVLGLRADERILCYPGSSHFANSAEMQDLYEAVFLLNRRGTPCRLIRTGRDDPGFASRFAADDTNRYVLHLGFVEREQIPDLLRLADVLVQPGRDDAFNHYRLPSKLPEFLASGRPVILPRANVGKQVRAGEEALLLKSSTAEEIAAACQRVFADPGLAARLAAGATRFARQAFEPGQIAADLERFYQDLGSPTTFWRVVCRRWLSRVPEFRGRT